MIAQILNAVWALWAPLFDFFLYYIRYYYNVQNNTRQLTM